MVTILIYFPHATERYDKPTDVEIKDGTLSFYTQPTEGHPRGKRISTNATFRIEESFV